MNLNRRLKRLLFAAATYLGLTMAGTAATYVRCAILQFNEHYPDEVTIDADRLAAQIRQAANNGAKIIVAPENCLYRYEPWSQNGVTQDQLAAYFNPMVAKFSALAAELKVCLVIGLREPSGLPKSIYQSAVFLGPDGSLLKKYRKRVPSGAEDNFTEPGGDDFTPFQTPYGKVWMQICKDMDGDLYTYGMPTDIDLFIGLSKDPSLGWAKVVGGCQKARCYGIGSNWGTGGNSGFVNPSGGVVAAAGVGETILYANLPLPFLSPDAYEPDDSISAAKSIGNGQTQSRSIHVAGDTDWAKFVVGASGARNVRIETAGASGDTQLWLCRANGTLVAFDDNGGGGAFSLIALSSLPAGTYYVKIRDYGNNGTIPAYTLKASWTVDRLAVSPTTINVPATMGDRAISVSANVAWTAAANQPWITIMGGAKGTGSGTVTYRVAANADVVRSGTITVAGGGLSRTFTVNQWPEPTMPGVTARGDIDGDGKADPTVFHPESGNWHISFSTGAQWIVPWGWSATIPVAADYDGDGMRGFGAYHPATGNWHIQESGKIRTRTVQFGWSETVPLPGDYDGDGKADLAVFHQKTGRWYFLCTTAGRYSVKWGWATTIPVPADYDGDGVIDVAVYHPASGQWSILPSSFPAIGPIQKQWGWSSAVPVPADYDSDGKADIAVFHRASGTWHVSYSGGGSLTKSFGWSATTPVAADYDGDGAADLAVYHPDFGNWHILKSTTGSSILKNWGWSSAKPKLLNTLIHSWFDLP